VETTTTVNLALRWSPERKVRCDFDPKGTHLCAGIELPACGAKTSTIADWSGVSERSVGPRKWTACCPPATGDLTAPTNRLCLAREGKLKAALRGQDRLIHFDRCRSGLLTVNALSRDSFSGPLQCNISPWRLSQLLIRFVVRQSINPQLVEEGIVLTKFDERNTGNKCARSSDAFQRKGVRTSSAELALGVVEF